MKTAQRRGAIEHFYQAKAELEIPRPGVALSPGQRKLLAELVEDTLNDPDPDAPSYTAAEQRELEAALEALEET